MYKKVMVVYFSGTGGTKRIADSFEEQLELKGCKASKYSLDKAGYGQEGGEMGGLPDETDLIVLLYPVYSLDCPISVYEWADSLPDGLAAPVAVISVSGGGNMWPNTSCRVNIIKALEKKKIDVIYEKMMVMPANVLVQMSDHLVMHLINCMPAKVNRIIDDIQEGKRLRDRFHLSTHLFSLFHLGREVKRLSNYFRIKAGCNQCGWCVDNCPRGNIRMADGCPKFGNDCAACLRCLYGCPSKSIYFDKLGSIILKEGFDLGSVEKRMSGVPLEPVGKCCKGFLLLGVKKYLLEKD